jgi:predicted secreted hydrolase
VIPARRAWLAGLAGLGGLALPGAPAAAPPDANDDIPRRGRVLRFPRDHGAHPGCRTEWWYVTGWMGSEERPAGGFQVTFFRSRTGLAQGHPSRFAARQLLFAHAAVTTLGADGPRHVHDQRIVRWTGDPAAPLAAAALDTARVHIGPWRLALQADGAGERWTSRIDARDFTLDLAMARTQPLLLQGDAGFSRKGPDEAQSSHYVTDPQLAVQAAVTLQGRRLPALAGRAWMDHEWSEALLHPQAVGWDWIGINLFDGGALTAFQLRRADGTALWAGGSVRAQGGPARAFEPAEVVFEAQRHWRSPATGVRWPVAWRVATPAGRHEVRALADAQELDSRASTGALYWEGLSELVDESGRRVGLGYLELTGYASPLRL